jgi:transposase
MPLTIDCVSLPEMLESEHRAITILKKGAAMGVRYREYSPEQTHFAVIDPKEIKDHNPLLLAIDSFVEEHVSIEPFSARIGNQLSGAPAVHPKMMLKILFYSYAKGIYSSREMEDRLRWDPNYIYLSANQKVDHSTICKFILQYEKEIKDLFSRLLYVMAKLGYVTMEFVAVDGTKIRANAGQKFTGDIREFKEKRKRIEKKIEQILDHTLDEELSEKYRVRKRNKLDSLQREGEKIDAFLAALSAQEDKEETAQRKVSLTDPDARMVKDQDSKYMGYNCQVAIDEEAEVIIGAEVFNEASDKGLLEPMAEEIRKRTGDDLEDTEIAFDAGYFSSENVEHCHAQKLNAYLPEGRGESGVKRRQSDTIESRDCKLEIEGEMRRLICPGGQMIEGREDKKDRGYYVYRFYAELEGCEGCAVRDRCYRNIRRHKRFSVKKEYFDTLPLREQMREKLSSPKGKQRTADRSCIVEHIFGEIKELFKFRRFLHRGLQKVRLVWTMTCMAYNFRKLARLAY